jgi:putative nucleotidyltransferase with HDIG domain
MTSIDIKAHRNRIENINALPTVPSTLKRISAIIEKPKLTIDELSHFIANDPALASRVLKMVNSAIYGFPGRISSISHAIMLLGLNVVKGLLLGTSIFEIMQKVMKGLWDHSLGCAVACRVIAEKLGLKYPEEVSVAGLLHDLGKVILILEYQKAYEEAIVDAKEKGIAISEAERVHFQETHAAVGMWLSQKWRLPVNLIDVMAYHHRPTAAKFAPLETAIVHFSDILVRARGLGFAGDPYVPAVHPVAFEMLRLSDDDIRDVLAKMDDSLEQTADLSEL